jgi:uncharacterized protein YcbK (DUF882 family)
MDSRHFSIEDFDCQSGAPVPLELHPRIEALMGMLDVIRDEWGGPISVVSGYRDPAYNAMLVAASAKRNGGVSGVAKDSQHVHARAADIRPSNATTERVKRLHDLILAMYGRGLVAELGGLGIYRRWVHVDIRPKTANHLARWVGTGVGDSG